MARIIAIDRRPRVVNRRMLTDARGATCCCRDVARLYLFRECCDNLPRFAVTQAVRDELVRRCSLTLGNFPTILVHQLGDQTKTCYSLDMTVGGTITREEAIAAGYPIIEDATRLECVDRTRPDLQPARCFASPTECRECPRQCCLTAIWRKACPDAQRVDALPKANVCCSYGRQAERTWSYSLRTEDEVYRVLNNAGGIDPFCPPGCHVELLTRRSVGTRSGRETAIFTACPDSLPVPVDAFRCVSAAHYQSEDTLLRRWNFLDPRPGDASCLTSEDTSTSSEYRSQDCLARTIIPLEDVGGGIGFKARPTRIARGNGRRCNQYIQNGGGEPACDDVQEVCTDDLYGDPNSGYTITTETTFRYGLACNQGSYYWRQVIEVRTGDRFTTDCPRGALVSRSVIEERSEWSIRVLDRRECPTNVCDGYARDGTISSFPVTPLGPQPIESGAFLFL